MFILATLIAAISYGLQNALMAGFYRSIDKLSAVSYRGLTLGISMAPLLFFVEWQRLYLSGSFFISIFMAALFAAAGNLCAAKACTHLPVGIANSFCMSFATLVVLVIGALEFSEFFSFSELSLIVLLLFLILILGKSRSQGALPKHFDVKKGLLSSAGFGICLGFAFSLVGLLSRAYDPFLVAYSWELLIGVVACLAALVRGIRGGSGLQALPRRTLFKLGLFSAPTALGTGLYSLGTTLGPLAIATAIISTQIIFVTIFSVFLYKETLHKSQWVVISLICLTIALLNAVTG